MRPRQPISVSARLAHESNQQRVELKRRFLLNENGRKVLITDQVVKDCENPWRDYSFGLIELKKERHKQWLERKQAKHEKLTEQVREMERKLAICDSLKDFGLDLSQQEQTRIMKNKSSA